MKSAIGWDVSSLDVYLMSLDFLGPVDELARDTSFEKMSRVTCVVISSRLLQDGCHNEGVERF